MPEFAQAGLARIWKSTRPIHFDRVPRRHGSGALNGPFVIVLQQQGADAAGVLFHAGGLDEEIEGGGGCSFCPGLPEIVQIAFGFRWCLHLGDSQIA